MRPRAAALAILMALPACGQSNPSSSGLPDDYSGSDAGAPGASAGNPCATPNEGCRCEAYGAVIDCGQVERRSGKFVSCSLGKRTCSGGRWGACIGDRISGQVEAPLPGKSPLALGNQSACLNNPCDPYCVNYVDNASDLDGGDNLTVVDGSLVLIQHEGGTSFTTCTGLVITPGPQTITVVGISPLVTVPDSVAFAAKLSPVGCVKGTVPATWAISNEDIAAIASDGTVKLYVPVAANLTVTGYAGSWVATTTASVVVSVQDKSLVPAATAALFDGTVSGVDTATVLYPYARTVFPRAIKAPVVG